MSSPCFNSKLVRLKGGNGARRKAGERTFQFQTGAIKRPAQSTMENPIMISFNSKLVRLKENGGKLDDMEFVVSIPNWCD